MVLIHTYNGVDLALNTVRLTDETTGYAALAKVGQPEKINVTVDDPAGALTFTGHKVWKMREAACAVGNQVVWYGFVGKKTWTRGPSHRTGVAREWRIQLVELNAFLGRRLLRKEATNTTRPEETVSARLSWLLTTVGFSGLIVDHGLVEASATVCNEHEYHGQFGTDVLRDIANQSGFNYFLRYRESSNDIEIAFRDELTSALDDVSATFAISNDLADVSESGPVWYANQDAEGDQVPERVGSRFQVPYDGGGDVIVEDAGTASAFAAIDLVAPSRFIKNATTATTYGNHLLEQHDTEEEYVRVWVEKLPAANLNDVKHGQLTKAKFTHGPGWESFRYCRVVRKIFARPRNYAEELWRLGLELQPTGLTEYAAANIMLYGPQDNNVPVTDPPNGTFIVNYDTNGDGVGSSPSGCPPSVTVGPLAFMGASEEWTGVQSTGYMLSGLVDSVGTFSGATNGGTITLTARILKNGSTLYQVQQVTTGGTPRAIGWTWSMRNKALTLVPGDQIQTQVTVEGLSAGDGYVIPNGTGNCLGPDAEQLWVRGLMLAA